MNPYPLASLNHFTLPVAIYYPPTNVSYLLPSSDTPKIVAEVTGGKKTVKCVLTAPSKSQGNDKPGNSFIRVCSRKHGPDAGHPDRAGGQTFWNPFCVDAAQRQQRKAEAARR